MAANDSNYDSDLAGSEDDPGSPAAQTPVEALARSFDSMPGRAEFSLLGDVFAVARGWYGFQGSIEDAKRLLQNSASFEVEEHHPPEECQIARAR